MRIDELEYHSPKSLAEASVLLHSLGDDAQVIAGGTDVLADLKQGLTKAGHLVSLAKISELRRIEPKKDGLWIGCMVTPNQLAKSEDVRRFIVCLCDAGISMGGNQIRNLATLGGNICSAVPSSDLSPPLLASDAKLLIASHNGEKMIQVRNFFLGPRKTVLKRDELVAAIFVPVMPPGTGTAYEKFQLRGASALAVVGVAARLTVKGGVIDDADVAVGASAPTPILIKEVKAFLKGKKPTDENFAEAGEFSKKEVKPITDLRGSLEYRRELASVLTKRALQKAYDRIQS